MNIIFLDVDGVLNSQNKSTELYNKTGKPHSGNNFPFDENCLKYLKTLVKETNSKIVITSTWRKYEENIKILINKLKEYDLDKEVVGYTPILYAKREQEIIEYLNKLNIKVKYVVLDDIRDMGCLNDNLVIISPKTEFTEENMKKAIKILKKG